MFKIPGSYNNNYNKSLFLGALGEKRTQTQFLEDK